MITVPIRTIYHSLTDANYKTFALNSVAKKKKKEKRPVHTQMSMYEK